jgi:hypothetical protein
MNIKRYDSGGALFGRNLKFLSSAISLEGSLLVVMREKVGTHHT